MGRARSKGAISSSQRPIQSRWSFFFFFLLFPTERVFVHHGYSGTVKPVASRSCRKAGVYMYCVFKFGLGKTKRQCVLFRSKK